MGTEGWEKDIQKRVINEKVSSSLDGFIIGDILKFTFPSLAQVQEPWIQFKDYCFYTCLGSFASASISSISYWYVTYYSLPNQIPLLPLKISLVGTVAIALSAAVISGIRYYQTIHYLNKLANNKTTSQEKFGSSALNFRKNLITQGLKAYVGIAAKEISPELKEDPETKWDSFFLTNYEKNQLLAQYAQRKLEQIQERRRQYPVAYMEKPRLPLADCDTKHDLAYLEKYPPAKSFDNLVQFIEKKETEISYGASLEQHGAALNFVIDYFLKNVLQSVQIDSNKIYTEALSFYMTKKYFTQLSTTSSLGQKWLNEFEKTSNDLTLIFSSTHPK
jgi:hypothetical protein